MSTLSPVQQAHRADAGFVKWRAHPSNASLAVSNKGDIVMFPRLGDRDRFITGIKKLRRKGLENDDED